MHVVEGVGCLQAAVHRVVHDGGGQCVKTQEVSHLPIVLSEQETRICIEAVSGDGGGGAGVCVCQNAVLPPPGKCR